MGQWSGGGRGGSGAPAGVVGGQMRERTRSTEEPPSCGFQGYMSRYRTGIQGGSQWVIEHRSRTPVAMIVGREEERPKRGGQHIHRRVHPRDREESTRTRGGAREERRNLAARPIEKQKNQRGFWSFS